MLQNIQNKTTEGSRGCWKLMNTPVISEALTLGVASISNKIMFPGLINAQYKNKNSCYVNICLAFVD